MTGQRSARLQVGSAPWTAEERSSAQNIVQDEIEEFTFSARNDFEWLNEHMADIFSENQMLVNSPKDSDESLVNSALLVMLQKYSKRLASYVARHRELPGKPILMDRAWYVYYYQSHDVWL